LPPAAAAAVHDELGHSTCAPAARVEVPAAVAERRAVRVAAAVGVIGIRKVNAHCALTDAREGDVAVAVAVAAVGGALAGDGGWR